MPRRHWKINPRPNIVDAALSTAKPSPTAPIPAAEAISASLGPALKKKKHAMKDRYGKSRVRVRTSSRDNQVPIDGSFGRDQERIKVVVAVGVGGGGRGTIVLKVDNTTSS